MLRQVWWAITTVTDKIEKSEHQNRKIPCDRKNHHCHTYHHHHHNCILRLVALRNIYVHARNFFETIPTMVGRPKSGLDLFKEEILCRYHRGEQCNVIALDYGASGRTLERRIQSWGVQKRLPKRKSKTDPLGDPEVRIFIGICWDRNLTDQEMQYVLESNSWKLTTQTIASIRKDISILQRVSVFQRQEGVSQL